MFSFFKKQKSIKQYSLKVDIHSHIIPYIDDGAKSIDESIMLLKSFEKLGYKKLITTPHIISDTYQNSFSNIYQGLEELQQVIYKENICLEIEVGAEYYIDDGFYTHLQSKDIMSIAGKYLLFETSYIIKPIFLEDIIFEILTAGYIPVMAHPERYIYIKEPIKEYKRFKDLGVLFQVNLNSFSGYYGKDAKVKANILSKEGMIDFLGSDVHNIKQIQMLDSVLSSKYYYKIVKNNTILNNIFL